MLRRIPVIILTNSSEKRDIIECYNLRAKCYIVKPYDQEEFLDIVKIIKKQDLIMRLYLNFILIIIMYKKIIFQILILLQLLMHL